MGRFACIAVVCIMAMALVVPAVSDPIYIYGMHDPGGEYNMAEKGTKGWIVWTTDIGSDPNNMTGYNYSSWSNAGYGVIVRLNNAYGSGGTLPYESQYANFAQRCKNYVAASPGVHYWIIGNECNLPREWPGNNNADPNTGEAITVARYVNCYNQCWTKMKEADPNAKICPAPTGTWAPPYDGTCPPFPNRGIPGFIDYWVQCLNGIGVSKISGLIIHTYTHNCDASLIYSETKMGPPYTDIYYEFRVYKNQMWAIPSNMTTLPVLCTESNMGRACKDAQGYTWLNTDINWVENAYAEINAWNQANNQKIRCLALFRWPDIMEGDHSSAICVRPAVITDWRQAMDQQYVWNTGAVGVIAGTVKDSGNNAISGASVSTTTGGYTATTNSSGAYTISGVSAGTYSVVASKSGYNPSTLTGKTVTAGATTTANFTLSLVTPGAITGNVKNSGGVNLSGATVSTTTGGYTTTTNSSGNYTLSSVTPGTYSVVASKSGYVQSTQTGKTVSSGATTTVNFTLTSQPFSGISNKNFEGGFYNDPDADHKSGTSWHRFSIAGSSKAGGVYGTYRSANWSQTIYEASWTAGIYQQATNCSTGNLYTASAYVRGADTNLKFRVGIDPTGGTNASSANVQWSSEVNPGTTWTKVSKQVAASSSTITMFIKAQNVSASNKYAYIDDADLVDDGAGTVGTISGNVKNSSAQNLSGATVSTTTGGYTATTDANGNYTMANVATGVYDVVASKSGYTAQTQSGKTVSTGATTTVNFTLSPSAGPIASEDFTTIPSWTSYYDATWGSAATFTSVTGGQSGNCMQASRTSQGSSSKVKVYTVPQNTSITISIYMKCPSYANSYWMETAFKLGSNTASNYDSDAASWTLIKKFSSSGTNGNGNVWTQYSVSVNTGSNTQISIGYKHGSSGYTGPTCWWDTFLMQ